MFRNVQTRKSPLAQSELELKSLELNPDVGYRFDSNMLIGQKKKVTYVERKPAPFKHCDMTPGVRFDSSAEKGLLKLFKVECFLSKSYFI